MTTHPNSLYSGIPIKDRLWALNTEEAHLREDFQRDDLTSVHLLVLRREHCGNGNTLTAFDGFQRSDPVASNMESALQLMLRAASHFRVCYLNQRNGSNSQSYPLQIYLEVVFESDEARLDRLAGAGGVTAIATGVHNVRHQVMRDVLNFSDADLERVARAQGGVVDHTLTTFMSEIEAGREVREYRLWFVCNDNTMHFNKCINDVLHLAFGWHEKRVTPNGLAAEDRVTMKQVAALLATGELASEINKASAVAGDNERWVIFENIKAYMRFVATYTGRPQFGTDAIARAAMTTAVDLNNENNPANPNNIYAPSLYFDRDEQYLRHIYGPQARFENYWRALPNNGFRFTFPLTSCVIEVPVETMEVAAFCRKLTPDHQARVIQPRLSKVHYPPICRLRGSTLFAKVMASASSFAALQRGEARASGARTESAAAREAAARARRLLDPVAEARATQVTASDAGLDTDDELDALARADAASRLEDELEENADLGAIVVNGIRNEAEIAQVERQRKRLLETFSSKFGSKHPTTLNGWRDDVVPPVYNAPLPEGASMGDESTTDSLAVSATATTVLLSGTLSSSILLDSGSNSALGERSLTSSQAVSAAERARLSTYDHGDAKTRKHERQVNKTASGGLGMTALDTLAQHFKQHLPAQRRRIAEDTELTLRYTTDQDLAFSEYEHNCCASTSNISATGCTINRFWETEAATNNDRVMIELKMVDKRLATFGIIVSQMTLDYDKACAVYAAHREALLLTFAACDTYRHEYNLHINPLFYGEAAVSKSFVLELIERQAIDGTIRSINAKTAAAANIDESRDDVMDVYQEFRAAWLVAPSSGGGAGGGGNRPDPTNKEHDQFKERIGTCRVTTEYFHMTVDGRRTSLLAHSSQIGNFGGATNLKKTDIAPPMLTRVWAIAMLVMRSENNDMASTDAAARAAASDRITLALSAEVKHDYRMFQLMHYHVEKLVYTGALTEPSLAVFNLYMPIFRKTLADQFSVSVPIRTMYRMEKLLRVLVIREALWRAYVLPGAPYRGLPFRINQLKFIDPWLRDNQKMVFWLFEFALDQYVDIYETILTDRVRAFVKALHTDVKLFDRTNDGALGGSKSMAFETEFNDPAPPTAESQAGRMVKKAKKATDSDMGTRHVTPSFAGQTASTRAATDSAVFGGAARSAAFNATSGATREMGAIGVALSAVATTTSLGGFVGGIPKPLTYGFAPSGLALINPEYLNRYNFQFAVIPGSVQDFARRLEQLMYSTVRPLSAAQIIEEMKAMSKRTIKTRRYIQDPQHGAPGHPHPLMPDPQDLSEHKILAMRIDWEQTRIFIASALLFAPTSNPAAAVIDACWDRFSLRDEVYLSGFPYRDDTPSLFAVKPMVNRNRPNIVYNRATLDAEASKWVRGGSHCHEIERDLKAAKTSGRKLPPWVTKEAFVVDCHVDQYATAVRLHRIALPWNNVDLLARFDPRRADAAWKAEVDDVGGKYPEDAFKALFNSSRSKRLREMVDAQHGSSLGSNVELREDVQSDGMEELISGSTRRSFRTNVDPRLARQSRALPGMKYVLDGYRQLRRERQARDAEVRMAIDAFADSESPTTATTASTADPAPASTTSATDSQTASSTDMLPPVIPEATLGDFDDTDL